MGGERIPLIKYSKPKNSKDRLGILVVDDDSTCLSIVAATLRKCGYDVEAVNHPTDALSTLRLKRGKFDLVVTDVHMPDMNGFELLNLIARDFDLPVVLMSADDSESTALEVMENGAVFFILKPISPDDVKDLWQFVVAKNESRVLIEDTPSSSGQGASTGHF